ncbi:MAG: GIY-YIG nuclease family protein [Gudongella sp.]|nr:GIY-YIG nuclease family protein [Gudongella sp.]
MDLFYVYILECNDKTLYTGYTNSLETRLKKHNLGLASKYTRGRIPVKFVYTENFSCKSAAMKREIEIKSLTRNKKLKLIRENRDELII